MAEKKITLCSICGKGTRTREFPTFIGPLCYTCATRLAKEIRTQKANINLHKSIYNPKKREETE